MTAKPLSFIEHTPDADCQKAVVDLLEEVLASAKKGEIRAVAIATIPHVRTDLPKTAFSTTYRPDGWSLLGVICHLRDRLTRELERTDGR